MIEKEAINVMTQAREDAGQAFLGKVQFNVPQYHAVIKALEKQIPKKPYDVDTECKTFDCPACLSKLYADEDVRDCTYCCVCGQALDWGEKE
ncbi:MAG TPA: hypothetical protein DD393_07200 [Ruminococcaceae bacterium]|nr:hypothetical protein [Oscillospiraceae bacterium]